VRDFLDDFLDGLFAYAVVLLMLALGAAPFVLALTISPWWLFVSVVTFPLDSAIYRGLR
jgi:hypothetical protein